MMEKMSWGRRLWSGVCSRESPPPPFTEEPTQMQDTSVSGYTLVEFALFLLCMSIFSAAILRGRSLLEQVAMKKLLSQVEHFRVAVQNFVELYHGIPGNFSRAQEMWGTNGVVNGSGNGTLGGSALEENSEASQFWVHLACAGLTKMPLTEIAPQIRCHSTAMGGIFTVTSQVEGRSGLWLTAGERWGEGGVGALLTPLQVNKLLLQWGEGRGANGEVVVTEGAGISPGECINQGVLNTKNPKKVCVVHFFLLP